MRCGKLGQVLTGKTPQIMQVGQRGPRGFLLAVTTSPNKRQRTEAQDGTGGAPSDQSVKIRAARVEGRVLREMAALHARRPANAAAADQGDESFEFLSAFGSLPLEIRTCVFSSISMRSLARFAVTNAACADMTREALPAIWATHDEVKTFVDDARRRAHDAESFEELEDVIARIRSSPLMLTMEDRITDEPYLLSRYQTVEGSIAMYVKACVGGHTPDLELLSNRYSSERNRMEHAVESLLVIDAQSTEWLFIRRTGRSV